MKKPCRYVFVSKQNLDNKKKISCAVFCRLSSMTRMGIITATWIPTHLKTRLSLAVTRITLKSPGVEYAGTEK